MARGLERILYPRMAFVQTGLHLVQISYRNMLVSVARKLAATVDRAVAGFISG